MSLVLTESKRSRDCMQHNSDEGRIGDQIEFTLSVVNFFRKLTLLYLE